MNRLFLLLTLIFIPHCQAFASDQPEPVWRSLDPQNSVLMQLPHGDVVIELAPTFSPNHVNQMKELIRLGVYDNQPFYRVIDGFVAQGGPQDESTHKKATETLTLEGEWSTDSTFTFTPIQENDMFAPVTGFIKGFALGHDPANKTAWLLHCPGVIAMARGNDPDSGTSHFYITIGQATRYLDRLMSIFGRVVYGMEHVHAIQRTQVIEGDTPVEPDEHIRIVSMRMMSDIPEDERIHLEIEDTETAAYQQFLTERRHRTAPFFFKPPPPVLDICQVPVKTRIAND
ncbi:peptidylprolyl isomerase [Alteromonas sediminis]|uniref:peptidylprolyl isomerase n=1 Tax=Alteromonas sediminis TaxID=2259342 RepID=A0A3N5Y718_9ALTE|nr:peptidylprolyl isomerase [Alteromonas sediminis]RPJ66419.1 peptidylprolyl isomerase [Alteromonas sediminis]